MESVDAGRSEERACMPRDQRTRTIDAWEISAPAACPRLHQRARVSTRVCTALVSASSPSRRRYHSALDTSRQFAWVTANHNRPSMEGFDDDEIESVLYIGREVSGWSTSHISALTTVLT